MTNYENRIRCNYCMSVFCEDEIIYDSEKHMDFCPCCGKSGCLMDLEDIPLNEKDIPFTELYEE